MGKCVLANQVCPQTSDPTARRYCPAWWETMAQDKNGNQRVMRGCAWAQLPMYLNEFASKAAGAAEAAQEGRNEVAKLTQMQQSLIMTIHSPVMHREITSLNPAPTSRPTLSIQSAELDNLHVPA